MTTITLSHTRGFPFVLVGLGLVGLLLALFFGLVAGTGNLIIVILIGGLFGGLIMVSNPTLLLWISLIWTLLLSGLIYYFGGLSKAEWLIYAAGAGLWLVAAVARFNLARTIRLQIPAPAFLVLFGLFFVFALISSAANWDGFGQFAVGIKNYLAFFGFTLALYYGAYESKTLRRIVLGALVIGLIQLPVTIYQFIFIRGHRLETGGRRLFDSEVEASDSVVGTMGGNMFGGGHDDVLAMLMCLLLAGVLAAWRYGALSAARTALFVVLLVVPVLLSETKIIFVYIPVLIMVVLWERLRARPVALVGMIAAMPLLIMVGLFAYYQFHWSSSNQGFSESIERAFTYSFSEQAGDYRAALGEMSRRESIEYWWQRHGLDETDRFLFGHGMAASKASSTVILTKTIRENGGLRLDKTGASQLLWDTGFVGTLLFIFGLLAASRLAGSLARDTRSANFDKAVLKAMQAGLLLVIISLLYKRSATQAAGMSFILFFMLGYVAYQYRVTLGRAPRTEAAEHL